MIAFASSSVTIERHPAPLGQSQVESHLHDFANFKVASVFDLSRATLRQFCRYIVYTGIGHDHPHRLVDPSLPAGRPHRLPRGAARPPALARADARRELTRVASHLSDEFGLAYAEARPGERIEGTYRRRLALASGRYALIEKSREFTLVPWRPVLERNRDREVSGIVKGGSISWELGRNGGRGLDESILYPIEIAIPFCHKLNGLTGRSVVAYRDI